MTDVTKWQNLSDEALHNLLKGGKGCSPKPDRTSQQHQLICIMDQCIAMNHRLLMRKV